MEENGNELKRQVKISVLADVQAAKKQTDDLAKELEKLKKQKIVIKPELDTTEPEKKVDNLKKRIADTRIKLSTSADYTELDKLFADLKGKTSQQYKFNLGIKVDNASQIDEVQAKVDQFKKEFGEISNLRFNVKQDSNIFNQINLSIKDISANTDKLEEKFVNLKLQPKVDSGLISSFLRDTTDQITALQDKVARLKVAPAVNAGEIKNVQQEIGRLQNLLEKAKNEKVSLNIDPSQLKSAQKDLGGLSSSLSAVARQNRISLTADTTGIERARNVLDNIRAQVTSGIIVNFVSRGLDAIQNAVGALVGKFAGGFDLFSSENGSFLQGAAKLESSQIALQSSLFNTAKRQQEANQRFAEGKGTLEDYATINKVNAESLQKEEKITAGVKRENIALKSELRDLEKQRKNLKDLTDDQVNAYTKEIKSIQNTIKDYEKQNKQIENTINTYEKEIKGIEKSITATEKQSDLQIKALEISQQEQENQEKNIDLTEKRLDRELKLKEVLFDRANLNQNKQILTEEVNLREKLNRIRQQEFKALNDPALRNNLVNIRLEQKATENQLKNLKERKGFLAEERDILIDRAKISQIDARQSIAEQQLSLDFSREASEEKIKQIKDLEAQTDATIQAQRDKIEGIKGVIEDLRENTQEGIKRAIDAQKDKISELQEQIEAANLKLELDTKPFDAAIERVREQIQQVADEQAALSAGGGSSTIKVTDPEVQARINALNASRNAGFQNKDIATLEREAFERSKLLQSKGIQFAADTPLKQSTILSLITGLETAGFDTLAGTNNGQSRITNAGRSNALNSSADLIARLKTLFRFNEDQAIEALNVGLAELSGGDITSLRRRFNISDTAINQALAKSGATGGAKDFGKLDAAGKSSFLAELNSIIGSEGLSKKQSLSFEGLFSTLQDNIDVVGQSIFGVFEDPNSLFAKLKKGQAKLIDLLDDESGVGKQLKDSLSSLGSAIGDLIDEALTPENIIGFADGIKSFAAFVKDVFTKENADKAIGFFKGVGSFVFGSSDSKGLLGSESGPAGRNGFERLIDTGIGAGAGLLGFGINPVAGAITTAGGAFFGNAIGNNSGVGAGVGGIAGGLYGAGIGAAQGAALGSVVPVVGTAAGAAIGGITGGILGAAGGVGAGGVLGALTDEGERNRLFDGIKNTFGNIKAETDKVINPINDWVNGIPGFLGGKLNELKDFVLVWFTDRLNDGIKFKDDLKQQVLDFVFQDWNKTFEDIGFQAGRFVADTYNKIVKFATEDVPNTLVGFGISTIAKFNETKDAGIKAFTDLGDGIKKFVLEDIPNFFKDLPNNIGKFFSESKDKGTNELKSLENTAKNSVENIGKWFLDLPKNIQKGFEDAAKNSVNFFGDRFNDFKKSAGDFFGGIGSNANSFAGGFSKGLQGRASGGPVDAFKMYKINERGEELFMPTTPGIVIPNDVSSRLIRNLTNSNTTNNSKVVNNNFNNNFSFGSGSNNLDYRTSLKTFGGVFQNYIQGA